ncbi:gamma-glutamylcyclotransferase family protein [Pseudochrobactrum sp. MP213Fo]|uniref:gamma-glutamylcyclotransferase family protein n=1 Tax=Pseudochrobactrum sp. MP213Fo TaxID=3022250 RepID=UPI003BA029DE
MERTPNLTGLNLPYFGYGTLLGYTHMRQQYPSANMIGVGFYAGHELGFARYADASDGGCTIISNSNGIVFGVLYQLSDEDMARMLKVGGLAQWYEIRELDITLVKGGSVRALTLRVDGDRGSWAPPPDYAALVIDGAKEAMLPPEYQQKLNAIVSLAQSK